jgi:hypothetical protein
MLWAQPAVAVLSSLLLGEKLYPSNALSVVFIVMGLYAVGHLLAFVHRLPVAVPAVSVPGASNGVAGVRDCADIAAAPVGERHRPYWPLREGVDAVCAPCPDVRVRLPRLLLPLRCLHQLPLNSRSHPRWPLQQPGASLVLFPWRP